MDTEWGQKLRADRGILVQPSDPAYVLFTSGTTGHPKAVVTPQHCLPHFVNWYHRTLRIGQDDRFTMLSGLGHDPLMRDIFVAITSGAKLCIPDTDFLRDSVSLSNWMLRCEPTVVHLTPTLASLLGAVGTLDGSVRFPSLRYIFLGGEMLSFRIAERLRQTAPNSSIVNCYGATETPQIASYYQIPDFPNRQGLDAGVPIGQGIDDVQVLLLTDDLRLAGPLQEGEICIRTPYLSLGYLNDEEATARLFVPNPFREPMDGESAPEWRDLIYRTGDRGLWDPNGVVTCLGRIDNQVKIRGFRVELEEIETALCVIEGVRKAAVIVREIGPTRKQLVGFVEAGSTVSEAGILLQLRQQLPSYMVPARIVIMEQLPRNANGKTDRLALMKNVVIPEAVLSCDSTLFSETEEILAAIWRKILSISRVGKEDDFFALGGDSLSTVELLIEIERAFGRRLNNAELIEHSKLQELAVVVEFAPTHSDHLRRADEIDLVTLWSEGNQNPIYWVPGGGGLSVIAFREISRLLQAQRPVYGLVSSLETAGKRLDLRAKAAEYVKALRRFQPEGPYHLFGYSMGSWLAYEMAMQMTEAGLSVGVLAVFDTEVP